MQQIAYFIQKYKYFLFFVFLSAVALALTINNHDFHKSKFISSANSITGGLYEKSSKFSEYLHLKSENTELIEENTFLKNQIELIKARLDSTVDINIIDSVKYHQKYTYTTARVIKNDYHKQNNFLLINLGSSNGVLAEMAVTNSKGLIGITDQVSPKFARVQSILNSNSKINARLKNSFHFGTLIWNGKDYNKVQLIDIPRQANVKLGDTIITGGKSTIFPEGILIGTVKDISHSNTSSEIDIKLFNDMSNIGPVYVIKNLNKPEINTLENTENE
ncbi:rod shape-determining protein MreC [Polaribacter pacificus]|uniref:Cell shape-determining protein MreC n=1 Tax=Polaribacter pacificus TaxID=1775173 RepID=A0A917HU47_9FLAO|nr:rod shape-determining protein MreC [Polaribacter pacificus]GGG90683.1 rod shape-determining protein MreC [Polaribacter pacificus]